MAVRSARTPGWPAFFTSELECMSWIWQAYSPMMAAFLCSLTLTRTMSSLV